MQRTRAIAAALLTTLVLLGCRADRDPVGPADAGSAFSAQVLPSSVTVSVDTIDRDTHPSSGRGVSDAGGIAVTVIPDPISGSTAGGVWTESGIALLPGSNGASAITPSGEVLGHSAGGLTIWGPAGPRIVGQGGAYDLNDLATVLIGMEAGPTRWDAGVTTPLQHPGGGIGGVFPLGVNNAGAIVGVGLFNAVEGRALLWDGPIPAFLPELAPGGAHGALAIDNRGRIVGYSTGTVDGVTGRFPVLWDHGSATPVPLPRLGSSAPFGNAQAIDDVGNIVGFVRMESGEDHAVLWSAAGELIDLGASLPGLNTYARGVNSAVVSGVAFRPGANQDTDRPILVRWTVRPATRYTFDGFLAPLANAPAVNAVKAGKGVPVRFSLGGDFGLNVFHAGYPETRGASCDPSAVRHEVNEAVNAKGSGLTFDPVSLQYTYLWKTERSWVGTCRELVFRFDDGQERVVRFQLMR